MAIASRLFGIDAEGKHVIEYTLTNERGMEMKVINYGCTITSLKVQDRDGVFENVVLGFDTLEKYIHSKHYIGAIIGRCANRIRNGKFILEDLVHQLTINHGLHHLHGGNKGFDKITWSAHPFENERGSGVDFFYLSNHGEEGYPGSLSINVRYFLSHENAVIFTYTALTDQLTVVNLTQHSYFNLNKQNGNMRGHQLKINARLFLPVDESLLPTGEVRSVKNSPFDFGEYKIIGKEIDYDDQQLKIAGGFDHTWVIEKKSEELGSVASLYDHVSGRHLEILSSEPGLQVYTGNFLDGVDSDGDELNYYDGICLETQHFPDSPNHEGFPKVTIRPGEKFQSTTVLKFSTRPL